MTFNFALAAFAFAVGNSGVVRSRDTISVDVGRNGRVSIEGTSNIADWRCRATAFEARLELDSAGLRDDSPTAGLLSIDLRVAVHDLSCGNHKMDHDLYAALGAADATRPSFILGRFEVVTDSSTIAGVVTRGVVTVAGTERRIDAPVAILRGSDGTLRARGAVRLLMTDFGVKPPVGLFGLIRSHNEITVSFDLQMPARRP